MQGEGVLITAEEYDVKKSVTIPTKDVLIETVDQDVLVLWKGAFHWKRSAEVGDGMEVVMAFPRESLSVDLDSEYVGYGLTLYREFDEEADEAVAYLYGFGRDEGQLEALNNILKENNIALTVERDGKFIAVKGSDEFLSTDIIEELSLQQAVNILFGIFLGYGKFVGNEESIHHVIINLPMVGSVPQYEPVFTRIEEVLKAHGIYIRTNYIDTRNGQSWQVDIYDWELLQMLKSRSSESKTIANFDQVEYEKPRIIEFLNDTGMSDEVTSMVNESVIKLWKR